MESVPDMDTLLDEIEDSVHSSVPLRPPPLQTKTIITAPRTLAKIDHGIDVLKVTSVANDAGIVTVPSPPIPVSPARSEPPETPMEVENGEITVPNSTDTVPNEGYTVPNEEDTVQSKEHVNASPPVEEELVDPVVEVTVFPVQPMEHNDYDDALDYLNNFPDSDASKSIAEPPVAEEIEEKFVDAAEKAVPSQVVAELECTNSAVPVTEVVEVADVVIPVIEPVTTEFGGNEDVDKGERIEKSSPEEELQRVAEVVADSIVEGCLTGIGFSEEPDDFYAEPPVLEKLEEEPQLDSETIPSELIEDATQLSFTAVESAEEAFQDTPSHVPPQEHINAQEPIVGPPVSSQEHLEPPPEAAVELVAPEDFELAREEHHETSSADSADEATPCQEENGAETTIATVHDLEQESDSGRLTESELMLGKQKPYWIPDNDCDSCMLCTVKFSLIIRRHHCRACGRVLCSNCCNKKAFLEYMKNEPDAKKPSMVRVCAPCLTMLDRIEEYNRSRPEAEPEESTSSGSRVRGVLKTREISSEENQESSTAEPSSSKRSVTFRDGVKPGSSSGGTAEVEKTTALKPKKKSRKRPSVVRKITEMKLEDELASVLPTTSSDLLLVRGADGSMAYQSFDWAAERLQDNAEVTVMVRKNLCCVVKAIEVNSSPVWSVSSDGFFSVGLDELLFVWKRGPSDFSLPLPVLDRISQIFHNALDANSTGVCQVSFRFPALHSVCSPAFPLPKHILFYRPTVQDFGALRTPSHSFLVACFLCDSELSWVMACPNRLLFRLGLKYGTYPHPIMNDPARDSVFSQETNYTVLKVFTDFRSWSYRMNRVSGSYVTLSNDTTVIRIPRISQAEIISIVEWNRSMIAWCCDLNVSADSHLVCEDADGMYTTRLLAKGSSRETTGASFVILDGGLKSHAHVQSSVVEDGVAIRLQAEQFRLLSEALCNKDQLDFTVEDPSGPKLSIEWVDSEHNASAYSIRSLIDGRFLHDKYQYGLSLERALTAVLEVANVPGVGVRLSHVYNLCDGRLVPEDEPKVFSIVEMLARECSGLLGPFLPMLLQLGISCVSLRFLATRDCVEYDISPWLGLEEENNKYKESMDKLIPILYNVIDFVSRGIHVELILSFVSTASLPSAHE